MSFDIVMKESEWDKWWAYQAAVDTEVACFGYCCNDRSGELYVDEIFLVPQIAEKSGVDFFAEGLPYAIAKAVKDERVDDLRFCIHSHYTYATSWSTTDEDMIRKIGSTGTPWFASAVTNRAGNTKARLDLWDPALAGLGQIRLTEGIGFYKETDHVLMAQASEELDKFLKDPPKYTAKTTTTTTTNGQRKTPTKDEMVKLMRGVDVSPNLMFLSEKDADEISELMGWEGIEFDGFIYWFDGNDNDRTCVAQSLAPDNPAGPYEYGDSNAESAADAAAHDMAEDMQRAIDLDDDAVQEQVAV